ncbi:2-phosphosulfolactate phosphatase [Flexithrix dorotheae]|uniref:2-phosphosulfolactate phosphatase n=1 Tax=Flexithrix dorotheae TaxID=70993 RepID=UPI000379F486|nr:2-phosphosulfolactate phosphatase [Flexithrix dorotheae]
MINIEVCYSPELIHLYELEGKIVVVTDILRATSSMVAGLGSGVKSIVPVMEVAECDEYGKQGFLTAGERNGIKVPHFNFGNSPFDFMLPENIGKSIAMTTTNGTRAINKSKAAKQVIIGSFLNLNATSAFLKEVSEDIVIFCAGWKGRFSMEDTLFAGALADSLKENANIACDAAIGAITLFKSHEKDLLNFVMQSNHAKRLGKLDVKKDIEFCMEQNKFNVVPILNDNFLSV